MSDTNGAEDLGPMPTPQAEEPELVPGGVDAIGEVSDQPVVPDLAASANPATENAPAETSEGEDTSTKATDDDDDADDVAPTEESPA
ncbi:hypothetical protein NOK12_13290 [Nocardioides sp. OK12]|uniref:Uncharacterized protein n=1 Tax=Nocardioides marinisabuli TaxID=419476 RepID=A0A7Y9F165_9ACTN|nr:MULTISPECIES: hypothetical protein [Nocardioides]NYD57719.1 hypothetical protein [Nocardioides marinisabuli]GHJ58811.1 hypothetical protein NOK12_13290 [Nocardioides sp. OK12]